MSYEAMRPMPVNVASTESSEPLCLVYMRRRSEPSDLELLRLTHMFVSNIQVIVSRRILSGHSYRCNKTNSETDIVG